MKFLLKVLPLGLLTPVFVFAQLAGTPNLGWFSSIIASIGNIVTTLIPLAIAIGLLVFIWGLVQYIFNSGDDGAKAEGKNKMIWGVIALFVMVAVWGIVYALGTIFGVGVGQSLITTPKVTL